MQPDHFHDKLLKVARADKPSDSVPFTFEKRVMARIRAVRVVDPWAAWSQALWRATAPCAAVALMLGAWTFFQPESSGDPGEELASHFEQTLLAGIDADSAVEVQ